MSCISHISSMFLKAKSDLKLSFQPKGALLCGWAVKGQGALWRATLIRWVKLCSVLISLNSLDVYKTVSGKRRCYN